MLVSGWSSPKLRKKPWIRKRYQGLKKNLIRWFLVILVISFLWFLSRYIRSIVFYNDDDLITEISFNEDSIGFISKWIRYDEAQEKLLWLHRKPLLRRQKNDIEKNIKSNYNILQSVEITADENLAEVNFVFNQPYLSITDADQNLYRIVDENILREVETWDAVLNNTVQLTLPDYLSIESISDAQWMFFSTHSSTLEQVIKKILDILFIGDITKLTFIPWGEKMMIEYLNKELIFHLDKSIDAQLAKMVDISNFFEEYESIQKIDLGSSDDIIVK